MALTSPGTEVSVIDQSQYLPAPSGSVPLVIVATAQNKADASGTGVAAATTAANAGKLFQLTSQRDLVNLYGSPFFYSTTNGTPIQGYELNEYGLLSAYSLLGVTNRCYVIRADIDMASLVGRTSRPLGAPANGTYWLDTANSTWGIYEFNATTGKFANKTPIVITDETDLSFGYPLTSIGGIGDYAVNAVSTYASPDTESQYFKKAPNNTWQVLGSTAWAATVPVVTGTNSNPVLSNSDILTLDFGAYSVAVQTTDTTVSGLANAINALGWSDLSAGVTASGEFYISLHKASGSVSNQPNSVNISGTGTLSVALGIDNDTYYQASVVFGSAAKMPLWTAGQTTPAPTGSVWIKVGSAGTGLVPVVAKYDSITQSWSSKSVTLASSDWQASSILDSTGGKSIAPGTLYAQYNFNDEYNQSPVYFWERIATGPTVVTGTATAPVLTSGPYTISVRQSEPGGVFAATSINVTIPNNATVADVVTAWSAANIPFTSASVSTNGALQLTHTEGGEITLRDVEGGFSTGVLATLGLVPGITPGCKLGPVVGQAYTGVSASGGAGTSATFSVSTITSRYILNGSGVSTSGTGYVIGDVLTIAGTALGGVTPGNDLVVEVVGVNGTTGVTAITYVSGAPDSDYRIQLSNWVPIDMNAADSSPVADPADGSNWFYSVVDQADIMVQKNGAWTGYRNTNFDANGQPTAIVLSGTGDTNTAGPIVSASMPVIQTDGSVLEYGDLWIDTSDLENYPVISRWESAPGIAGQWTLIDNSDQTSSTGIVFADARWGTSGTVDPASDAMPTIASLLVSNYVELDVPSPALYPQGTLLFNTRRSGYNVKQFKRDYFNIADFPDTVLPSVKSAWVSVSGNKGDGSPYMGRKAQRAMVVEAMKAAVSVSSACRDEDNFFNLIAAPGYPELQSTMVALNNDRGMTAFIIGDTPMRLAESATDIQAWATNAAGADGTGEEGCVTRDTNLGLFYPSGIANDLSGNQVVVPASHMMLRTFLRSDNISYPWLAAAGTRRGTIDNADNIGYLDAATGEFISTKTRLGIRDTLYSNLINPMVFFTGVGLLNYGNKTSFASNSALDRVNVARLVNHVRRQLTIATRPFVFEPNDSLTRQEIAGVVQTLFADLVAKRGIYDYIVVCDESNNTPARVDRNELWVDVAIEPVKAAEFIYIPVRIMNTGEL